MITVNRSYREDYMEENDIIRIIEHIKEAEKRKKELCETFPIIAQLKDE